MFYKIYTWSPSQDGGIGRDPSLPHTTKRRITTNVKSINNQNFQKIKLHGTLTTKELKKKSTRTTRPLRRWTLRADSEKLLVHGGLWGWGWLPRSVGCAGGADLRGLRGGCVLLRLLRWEKLPVSHESLLESVLEMSRWAALFLLWPLAQCSKDGCPAWVNT